MVRLFPILFRIKTLAFPLSRVRSCPTQVSSCPNPCAQSFIYLSPNILSFAVTEKHTETGKNARFAYGLSEMQGWRLSEFQSPDPLPFLLSRKHPSSFFPLLSRENAISSPCLLDLLISFVQLWKTHMLFHLT